MIARGVRIAMGICLPFVVITGCKNHDAAATPAAYHPPSMQAAVTARFAAGVFGASGVVQLPDGRVLIAEDEQRHPFDLVDLFATGTAHNISARDLARVVAAAGVKGLNDLEALTIDPRGHVYASTSHALTARGASKREREMVVRFDVGANGFVDFRWFDGLRSALTGIDRVFAVGVHRRARHHRVGALQRGQEE
ncbi:MAG: hypothetical protein ABI983_07360, partial [Acidobacteriota bacterium]